ncbi:hypothetical protein Taro_002341 [Colocasia esculenta]|uniref:Uncharacterized protein n=1 Tax=Colocasia esculenta TaxID=4460 RepID=A0A843TGX7_COLES|nr:hypothetical protein [Colocasia esculenta]
MLAPDGPAGRALLTESLHKKVMRARKTKSSGASNGCGGKSKHGRARRPQTMSFNRSRTTIMEAPLVVQHSAAGARDRLVFPWELLG